MIQRLKTTLLKLLGHDLTPRPYFQYVDISTTLGIPSNPLESKVDHTAIATLLQKYSIDPRGVLRVQSSSTSSFASLLNSFCGKIPTVSFVPSSDSSQLAPVEPELVQSIKSTLSNYNGKDSDTSIRTLDHALLEHRLSPSSYNLLSFDIGIDLCNAIKGATHTLPKLDIIEVLCTKDQLFRPDLPNSHEQLLHLAGFHRVITDLKTDGIYCTVYIRRPLVTMSTFGKNGRFGNQLFQYLFLRLVCERQNAVLQIPEWIGRTLYDLREPQPLLDLPLVREKLADLDDGLLRTIATPATFFSEKLEPFADTDFWGYFQLNTSNYSPHKAFIRDLYTPKGYLSTLLSNVITTLSTSKKRLLAIHLRRGDYGNSIFFKAPCSWYQKWILEAGLSSQDTIVYIASESPDKYTERFYPFDVLTFSAFKDIPSHLAALVDFHVLCHADYLLISNSSNSFMASMLNTTATCFMRPDARRNRLVPYDPWDATPLLWDVLSPEEHAYLESID